MRAKLFQISWHAKDGGKNDPILSIDFHPTLALLATAGGDDQVRFWAIREPGSSVAAGAGAAGAAAGSGGREPDMVDFRFTMSQHNRWVNAVRFSPNGAWRPRSLQLARSLVLGA